jgi:UDP-3-O-[3-hydroxymyristoyl] glucosamine N-acyltransferase
LGEISQIIGGELLGPGDLPIAGLSNLEGAEANDLAYLTSDQLLGAALSSRAGAILVPRPIPELKIPQIVVANPAYAFTQLAQRFVGETPVLRGIAPEVTQGEAVEIGPDASIWPFVTLGDRVRIGARVTLFPGVFIGDDTVIGDDVLLYPNVTVREGCAIGHRVIIHSGTVIGSDGFGYVQRQGHHHKIPQLGGVTIEDDVEIGANVTIDRATFTQTLIRRGTKIDNLVHIAHNVTIGEDSVIVGQVGIAGSTKLGRYVMIGGQAGLAGHIEIGDNVKILAKSGVTRSIPANQIVSGAPAMPHQTFLKAQGVIPLLPELRQQLRELQQRVRELEKALSQDAGE